MSNKILIPVVMKPIRERVDGSASFSLDTGILTDEQYAIFRKLKGQACYCLIKDSEITAPEEDLIDGCDEFEGKSPTKRLFDRMFVYWNEVLKDAHPDFHKWRKNYLDTLGQKFLDKLNDQK